MSPILSPPQPRLLDCFSGAGGAARGYMDAGFHVTGVDIKPQPRYCGDRFIQADVMLLLRHRAWLRQFDAIHASPPCQGYSVMHNLPWLRGRVYPLLIKPVREALEDSGLPWVIENVMGARKGAKGLVKRGLEDHGLEGDYLCGAMFGLPLYRHRLFASGGGFHWTPPEHPKHPVRGGERRPRESHDGTTPLDTRKRPHLSERLPGTNGTPSLAVRPTLNSWQRGNGAQAPGVGVGHAAGWRIAAKHMGIDWMNRHELTQAIPPLFTWWIGDQLREYLCPPS